MKNKIEVTVLVYQLNRTKWYLETILKLHYCHCSYYTVLFSRKLFIEQYLEYDLHSSTFDKTARIEPP